MNRIEIENAQVGTNAYEVTQHAREQELEAYAGATSVVAGDSLDVHVNTSVSAIVLWQVFRLGYYGGQGGREVARGENVRVEPQPDCPPDPDSGLVECDWATAFSVAIDPAWLTGYYLVKLTREDGFETTAPFVLREAEPNASVLVQASMNTWQAYNLWGGTSLYHGARRVSYDRPYTDDDGSGQLFRHEIWLVRWLEERGIDVSYTTNVDVDREPDSLLSARLFAVSGHDEYWTVAERDALDAARDAGVSLAILSANTGYWRVRLDPSSGGVERRIITCYKDASVDPERNAVDTTVKFRDAPHARPENELTGVLYEPEDYPVAPLPLYVAAPEHWIFEGTGVKRGDSVGVALGGEWDEFVNDSHEPAGVSVVLSSPGFDTRGGVSTAAAAVYEPSAGSVVFSAGTEEFAHALADPHAVDPRARRMLENVLTHAGVDVPHPTPSLPPAPNTSVPGQVTILAGSGTRGYRDGEGRAARFDFPSGLALGPDDTLYVTESGNHTVRSIRPDGEVSTLAGCGPHGSRRGKLENGRGTEACFDRPNGIAVRADGTVFVADTGNHLIRAITPSGRVTTYAGNGSGSSDGTREQAQFETPMGVTLAEDGTLFVVEAEGRVREVDTTGQVTTLTDHVKGATAVAVGPDGGVYVAIPNDGRIVELRGDQFSVLTDRERLGGDRVDGTEVHSPLDAWLRPSYGLSVVGARVVFSDTANDAVRELVLGASAEDSRLETIVSPTSAADTLDDGTPAGLSLPRGIVPYGAGYAVADSAHHRIVLIRRAELAAAR